MHSTDSVINRHRLVAALALLLALVGMFCDSASALEVGVAKVDITPSYPVRLAGYASRKTESEGVAQRLYAKALAFGTDRQRPAILITVDNCGVPEDVRGELATRLRERVGLESDRLAICSTHTHSGPLLSKYLRNLFYPPISAEEQATIDRYTRELIDALEKAALAALEDRRPAALRLGRGTAGFAANRRTPGGPVDHDVPVLLAESKDGHIRAILANYACHCTTLTGEFNQVCGDWAGYAAERLEQSHPGAVVLISIGCGGDANPFPRPGFELAQQHGKTLAGAVEAVISGKMVPVSKPPHCQARDLVLPYDVLPSKERLQTLATQENHIGQQARWNLARLERGEQLPTGLGYRVQTWVFGKQLAMVFLPGEVVVDYSLRLKRELDPNRLWINGYANDVPCYIPSERVLKEGGYEGEGAMVYYDRPARFAPGIENRIVSAVRELIPKPFVSASASKSRPKM